MNADSSQAWRKNDAAKVPRLILFLRLRSVSLTPTAFSLSAVKFFEYLAAGKPVVATPLPSLADCRKLPIPRWSRLASDRFDYSRFDACRR
jgi:hypothetical protein